MNRTPISAYLNSEDVLLIRHLDDDTRAAVIRDHYLRYQVIIAEESARLSRLFTWEELALLSEIHKNTGFTPGIRGLAQLHDEILDYEGAEEDQMSEKELVLLTEMRQRLATRVAELSAATKTALIDLCENFDYDFLLDPTQQGRPK